MVWIIITVVLVIAAYYAGITAYGRWSMEAKAEGGTFSKVANNVTKYCYSDAVLVIMESSLTDDCKLEAVQNIDRDECSDYYKTVIGIILNSNVSNDVTLSVIKAISGPRDYDF